jgi:hypothetical protein
VAVLWSLPRVAAAQPPDGGEREEMRRVDFLIGQWDGEGWVELGPGQRKPFTIHEAVQSKLDGLALLLEGQGKSRGPDGKERVTHRALATVVYEPQARAYRMSAYRAGGGLIDSDVNVNGQTMTWGYTDPRAGQIRFNIRLDGKGRWVETGEASRDAGKTWHQFLEMTLHRG